MCAGGANPRIRLRVDRYEFSGRLRGIREAEEQSVWSASQEEADRSFFQSVDAGRISSDVSVVSDVKDYEGNVSGPF